MICQICENSNAQAINIALTPRIASYTFIATKFNLNVGALVAHERRCLISEPYRLADYCDQTAEELQNVCQIITGGFIDRAANGETPSTFDLKVVAELTRLVLSLKKESISARGHASSDVDLTKSPVFSEISGALCDALRSKEFAADNYAALEAVQKILLEFSGGA